MCRAVNGRNGVEGKERGRGVARQRSQFLWGGDHVVRPRWPDSRQCGQEDLQRGHGR